MRRYGSSCLTTEPPCDTTEARCLTTEPSCDTTEARCLTTEPSCDTTEARCLTTEAPGDTTEASVVTHRASVVSHGASVVCHGAPRRPPEGSFVRHHALPHNGGAPFVSQRIAAKAPGRTATSPALSPGSAAPSAEPPPNPALAKGPSGSPQDLFSKGFKARGTPRGGPGTRPGPPRTHPGFPLARAPNPWPVPVPEKEKPVRCEAGICDASQRPPVVMQHKLRALLSDPQTSPALQPTAKPPGPRPFHL